MGEAEIETIREHFLLTFAGSFSKYTEVILKESTAEGDSKKRRVGQRGKVRGGRGGISGENGCLIEV